MTREFYCLFLLLTVALVLLRTLYFINQPMLVSTDDTIGTTTEVRSVRRNVYIDMGANWANTLRLYKDFAADQNGPFEVYAFEASPLIQPYLEAFVNSLSTNTPAPKLAIPPAGSSLHLKEYAHRYGCDPRGDFRVCLWNKFRVPLAKLSADPGLANLSLIKARLAEAQRPLSPSSSDRFTHIPAACSAETGTLHLGKLDANQMIRGGAISFGPDTRSGNQAEVAAVDVVEWLAKSFSENDFVFVKMDVEGAEFAIMQKILSGNAKHVVKRLFLECHNNAGNCGTLRDDIKRQSNITVVEEGQQKYMGYHSMSTPDKYFPEDP